MIYLTVVEISQKTVLWVTSGIMLQNLKYTRIFTNYYLMNQNNVVLKVKMHCLLVVYRTYFS